MSDSPWDFIIELYANNLDQHGQVFTVTILLAQYVKEYSEHGFKGSILASQIFGGALGLDILFHKFFKESDELF